jgi:hypothetical protein
MGPRAGTRKISFEISKKPAIFRSRVVLGALMTVQDQIRFHTTALRSSLDILARAIECRQGEVDGDESHFLSQETPLALADAREAIAALEELAKARAGATRDSAPQPVTQLPRASGG